MQPTTCSNCGEPLEAGAAFCGNCGHPIAGSADKPAAPPTDTGEQPRPAEAPANQPAPKIDSPIAQAATDQTSNRQPGAYPANLAAAGAGSAMPSYALPVASNQSSATKAGMGVVFGVLGIIGGLFIPLVGLGLGIAGLVLATMSHRLVRRRSSTIGIVLSVLAILASLASWAYVIAHDPRLNHKPSPAGARTSSGAISAQNLITPCYSVNFANRLNIQNNSGSCNMSAFNGSTLDVSSDAYKVYGTVSAISAADFPTLAKQAIDNDVRQSLPSFTVTSENSGQFANSPAYFVTANNGKGVSIIEAAAFHKTTNGDNFFVLVHAANANAVDLKDLQSGWHWE